MKCNVCGNPIQVLFFGTACDYCEGKVQDKFDFRGFIVHRPDRTLPSEEYVFATKADAERWKELSGLFEAKIKEVAGNKPFRWQPSKGVVRGIILADRLFEVFPNHRFEPRPNRCCLKEEE